MNNDEDNLIKLGQKFKELREQRGLSANDVAARMTVSAAFYSKLENGKVRPTRVRLNDFFAKFEIPLEDKNELLYLAKYDSGAVEDSPVLQSNPADGIKIDTATTPILFSDMAYTSISDSGVVFDFGQKLNFGSSEVRIVSRIGVSVEQTRRIYDLLGQQLTQFDKNMKALQENKG